MGKVNYLLDTHALLWWAFGQPDLSKKAAALIGDRSHTIYVSSASAWEISTKYRLGRLPAAAPLVQNMSGWFEGAGLVPLPISIAHAERAGLLPGPHRDPFDRMIVAQGLVEQLPIIGCDQALAALGGKLIW